MGAQGGVRAFARVAVQQAVMHGCTANSTAHVHRTAVAVMCGLYMLEDKLLGKALRGTGRDAGSEE